MKPKSIHLLFLQTTETTLSVLSQLSRGKAASKLVQFTLLTAALAVGRAEAQVMLPLSNDKTNPAYALPCYVNGDPLGGGNAGTSDSIVISALNDSGTTLPLHAASSSETGAVWGTAYQSTKKRYFSAAYVKRHVGLGPLNTSNSNGGTTGGALTAGGKQGLGAIYVTNLAGSTAVTTGWVNLEDLGVNFGAFTSQRGLPASNTLPSHDPEAFAMVGRSGIGDIDVTENEKTLFVVNAFNRSLIKVNINSTAPPSSVTETVLATLPGYPADPASGELRPWALAFHNGKGYLGVVNDASTSMNRSDLQAWVLEFNPNNLNPGFVTVANFPLDYLKGPVGATVPAVVLEQWNPWVSAYDEANYQINGRARRRAEPLLSDIGFSNDNGMTLTFMDLTGSRLGSQNFKPDVTDSTTIINSQIGGEILRLARQSNGMWTTESNASVTGSTGTFTTSGAGNNQGIGGGEFYNKEQLASSHLETTVGSLAPTPDYSQFRLPIVDPIIINSGGLVTFDAFTADSTNAYQLYLGTNNAPGGFFGKAIGFGDIELLCPYPKQGIGNLIFCDVNKNGKFDAGDTRQANVTVELYYQGDSAPIVKPLQSTVTDSNGNYFFGGLAPGQYVVRVPAAEFATDGDLAGKASSTGVTADTDDNNGEDGIDALAYGGVNSSNVLLRFQAEPTNTGVAALAEDGDDNTSDDATNDSGIDLTVDLGFYKPIATLGGTLWDDVNNNGVFDSGESPLIGVTVAVCNENGLPVDADPTMAGVQPSTMLTDAGGNYQFTNLFPASYQVKVSSPADYHPTTVVDTTDNQEDNDNNGSPTSIRNMVVSPVIELVEDEVDLTVDFGLLKPSIGGFAWKDFDNDGVYDPGEALLPGITVRVTLANGTVMTTQTNEAGYWWLLGVESAVRVEFVDLPAGCCPGLIGPTKGAATQFASAGNLSVNLSVVTPGAVTGNTPNIFVPCYVKGPSNDPANAEIDAVVRFNTSYAADVDGNINGTTMPSATLGVLSYTPERPLPSPMTTAAQVGSVWGLGYSCPQDRLFMAAYLKRSAAYAAGTNESTGAIFFQENANSATPATPALWVDLNALFGANTAGPNTHPNADAALWNNWQSTSNTVLDKGSAAYIGKVALGDLDVTPDGQWLYVVNLYDRKLYRMSAVTQPTSSADVESFDIERTGFMTVDALGAEVSVNPDDLRPFGLGFDAFGNLHVGLVNTSQSITTGKDALNNPASPRIRAYVVRFDRTGANAGSWTQVFDFPLTYNRDGFGTTFEGSWDLNSMNVSTAQVDWEPWADDVNQTSTLEYKQNQAMLSDIDFDGDCMILSFRDRFGDQAFGKAPSVGGDTLRACKSQTGVWVLENDGIVNGVVGSGPNYTGPGRGVFYDDRQADNFPSGSLGSAFVLPNGTTVSGLTDPVDIDSNGNIVQEWGVAGVAIYDNLNGAKVGAYNVYLANYAGVFGKAAGLGDIEPSCEPTKREIGDRIWDDKDGDGIQDPDENGVIGVKIALYDDTGAKISQVTTDANGCYLFSANTGTDASHQDFGLTLDDAKAYTVGLLDCNYEAGAALENWGVTKADEGANDEIDSDVTAVAVGTGADLSSFTYVVPPITDDCSTHTKADIGVFEKSSLGNLVFFDKNEDGLFDTTGGDLPLNGVSVQLFAADGTTPVDNPNTPAVDAYILITGDDPSTPAVEQGVYCFTGLTPGDYVVKIAAPPAAYPISSDVAVTDTADNEEDNDDNGTQASSGAATVSPVIHLLGGEDDKTVDFGFICPPLLLTPGSLTGVTLGNPMTSVTFSTAGGVTPYTYSISDGSLPPGVTLSGTGLLSGTPTLGGTFSFTILVKDNAGCEVELPMTLEVLLPAAIGDKVWKDLNRNGVQDSGEPGVENVTVTLLDATNNPIGSTVTNATGDFIFNGLMPGTYSLSFPTNISPTCILTSPAAGSVATDSDPNSGTGITAPIIVAAGQVNDTADAGYISPRASLGNYVWKDYDRDGVQDAGEPGIQNVTVTLLNSVGTPIGSTVTDATGNYTFWDLVPGNYSFRVATTLPDGCILGAKDQGSDDTLDSDGDPITGQTVQTTLSVGENDPSWDFGFLPLTNVGDYVWKDYNNNGLQEAGEPGLVNVVVKLYNSLGALVGQDTTDAFGKYEFAGLTPGTYQIEFPKTLPEGCKLVGADLATDDLDSDPNPATGRTANVIVGADQTITKVDAGYYSPKASLGDYVWKDSNRNGIQDGGEPGIEGVTVILLGSDGNPVSQTTTDSTGHYYFADLTPGDYSLQFPLTAGAGCTLTDEDQGTDDKDSDADTTTGKTISTTLVAGENDTDWDAGYVSPYGSISDYVWKDLVHNGLQDAGEPGIEGVTVYLLNSSGVRIGTTTTDSLGAYSFGELLPGIYSIEFPTLVGSNCALVTADSGGDDELDSDASTVTGRSPGFVLTAGQVVSSIDAGYSSPDAAIGNYVWKDLNANGVQDGGEPGIANVLVTLYNSAGAALGATLTDATGQYYFSGLTPGDYYVGFPPSLNQGTCVLTGKDLGGSDASDSDADLNTGYTEVTTLVAGENDPSWDGGYIFPGASLGDYVWKDLNQDGKQDAGEPGIEGVRITLLNSLGVPVGTTVTDGTGHYSFSDLDPGDYKIQFPASLPDGCELTLPDVGVDTGDSDADDLGLTVAITLTSGENDSSWDAGYIMTKASLGDYVWKDLDRDGIQDAGEPGIQGVTVELLKSSVVVGTTQTDGTGHYTFTNLTPGDYQVKFPTLLSDGCAPTRLNQGADDALDSDITVATGLTANVTLTAGENDVDADAGYINMKASLGDYVWKDLNRNGAQDVGEPGIAGVTVTVLDSAQQPVGTAVTDGTGKFLFINLAPGNYYLQYPTTLPDGCVLTAPLASGSTTDSNPAVSTGKTGAITLAAGMNNATVDAGYLSPKASLGNYVWKDLNRDGKQDAGEPGIADVTVTLLDSTGTPIGTKLTNSSGYYSFIDLAPGIYQVQFPTALHGNCVLTYNDVTAVANLGSDADLTTGVTPQITLDAGENDLTWDAGYYNQSASIGDYVWKDLNRNGLQDLDEPGIANVTVTLLSDTGAVLGTTVTDSLGYFLFDELAPGSYKLRFPTTASIGCVLTAPGSSPSGDDSDATVATGETGVIELSAGEVQNDVDAGYVSPFASLGNFVWKDDNKNGQQDLDEPGIANVVVRLRLASNNRVIGTTTTDATGYYSFADLVPGNYIIQFPATVDNGRCVITVGNTGADATDSDASLSGLTAPVTLVAGQNNSTVDAGYVNPLAALGNYVWKDLNRDGVQDAGEPGIANVEVRLLNSAGVEVGHTVTDGTGFYVFESLQPGTYTVKFPVSLIDGCVIGNQGAGGDIAKDSDPATATGLTATVTLAQGERNLTVDAAYTSPKASLGNLLWKDLNLDGVQDLGEPGLANQHVVLYKIVNGSAVAVGHDFTDGEGYYHFADLMPGDYFVEVATLLTDGCIIGLPDLGGDDAKDSDASPTTGRTPVTTLSAGENDPTWDIGYNSPAASLGDYVWKDLNRNGIQEAGEPGIEGVRVILLNAAGTQIGLDVTDGTGHYAFTNLAPGTYSIKFPVQLIDGCELGVVDAPSDDAKDSDALPTTGVTASVTLLPGESRTNVDAGYISPLLCVGNFVWEDLNHDGVQGSNEIGLAGAKVELLNANGLPAKDANDVLVPAQNTLADGAYKFVNLASGNYIIRVTPPAGYINTIGGIDPDNDNNADSNGVTFTGQLYVQSLPVTLTSNSEPANDGDNLTNSNLSVDFGFYKPSYDLALRKLIAPGQKNPVKEGEKVSFTIEVFNQGDIPVKNVKVVDYTPAGFMLDTAASPNWSVVGANAEGLLINTIPAGDSSMMVVTYNVTSSAALGANTNWAEIFEAQNLSGDVIADKDSTPDKLPSNDGIPTDDEINNGNSDEDDHDGSTIAVASPGTWDLALRKTLAASQSPSVNAGDEVTYALEVFNQGTEEARNIRIIDYIPASMTLADGAWSAGPVSLSAVTTLSNPIAPGASAVIDITLKVNTSSTGPRTITNVAEVLSFTDKNNVARVDADSTPDSLAANDGPMKDDAINNEDSDQDDHDIAKVTVNAPKAFDLALRKRLAQGQAAQVAANGVVNFEFEVFNQGAVPAKDVVITDYMPANLMLDDAAWTMVNSTQANITLNGPIQPGDSMVFTLKTKIAASATAFSTLSNGAEITSAKDDQSQPAVDRDSTMDNVANNDGAVTDDKIANENGDQDDHDIASVTVAPPGMFDLALRKTLSPGQSTNVNPGDKVSYNIEVFNQGAVPARGLTVTDYIPAGMTLEDAAWTDNGNSTASGGFGASFILQPGASVTMKINLRVAANAVTGQVMNMAEISTARDGNNLAVVDHDSIPDGIKGNDGFITDDAINNENFDEDDHDQATVTVNPPDRCDLAMRMSLKPGQSTGVRAGDAVYYRMEVFNQGRLPATNITVCDYLPPGLSFEQGMNAFWTVDTMVGGTPAQVSCTLTGPLAPGASAQLDLCLKVATSTTATINGNGMITNYAEVCRFTCNGMPNAPDHDSTPDSVLGNDGQVTNDAINNEGFDEDDMDMENISIMPPERFDLALRKTAKEGPTCIHAPGDKVCFIMEVFNQGAVAAKDIKVYDYVPTGMSFSSVMNPAWSVESGGSVSCVIPGPIAPGASHAIEVCMTVDPTAVNGSVLRNCAEICMAKDAAGQVVNDADSVADNNASNDGRMTDNAINNEAFDEDDYDCQDVTIQTAGSGTTQGYKVGDFAWMDSNSNGVQDSGELGLAGVTVTLRNSTNVVVATTTTDSTGKYQFTNVAPGTYTVQFVALPGFNFTSQGTGTATDSDVNASGNATVTVSSADRTDIDAGYAPALSHWQAWLANTPAAANNATADIDADSVSSLAEYAFGLRADSGLGEKCPVELKVDPATGRIDGCVRYTTGGAPALKVTLESLTDLALSPAGWTPVTLTPVVTNHGDGTQTVCYSGVNAITNLTNQGFIRAKITLDTNGDTIPEHTAYSDVLGWSKRTVLTQCETYSQPYIKCAIFTGLAGSSSGNSIAITAGSMSFSGQLQPGNEYYLEVLSGTHAGHRFEVDEAASSASSIALHATHPRNTQAVLPSLSGAQIAVRAHWVVNDVFKAQFTPSMLGLSAGDRLMFWNGTGFDEIWYAGSGTLTPRWTADAGSPYADAGNRVITPCEGFFVHPRLASTSVLSYGIVRKSKLACPIKAGTFFLGSGWPMPLSPNQLSMNTASGFTGGSNAASSDRIRLWLGDANFGQEGYSSNFLLNTATRKYWTAESNASLLNENNTPFWKSTHAVFFQARAPVSSYCMPAPWTP